MDQSHGKAVPVPGWVPDAAKRYLDHIEGGRPIRAIARDTGLHPSTVLRQIRRIEMRRDDPLVDAALSALRGSGRPRDPADVKEKGQSMTLQGPAALPPEEAQKVAFRKQARRVLRRLCETGAVLAVAQDMDKAVVVRDTGTGTPTRTAVVAAETAQALALKDWIACKTQGRIARYTITAAGRAAFNRMVAEDENRARGFAEAQATFADQHRAWDSRDVSDDDKSGKSRRVRYNVAESPLTALARRRDKAGEPFLTDDLVIAGERLREDFELAQMGPRVTQNWDRFLTGGDRGGFSGGSGTGGGSDAARERVAAALKDLGPGLGDVALRCCCYLEGLEAAEKRMGWSARSGKIVLRIALQRLRRHYEERHGPHGPLIG
ncbi:hypothetical protein ATO11_14110 [Pseudaestuariivita atlantica]|uniref:DUF6456 domain-containing protein n=1 Tax=Pseudaestuariivita atlantica TaxID=1317121 RepID=A0A0L1JP10_9RHOB|nr:hypothetical protein ATO11_14110 [Pseudaestuariivita atlantica]